MSATQKKQKVKRFKAGPELARTVQELHKKHPDNDLYEVITDVLKLPQQEQHELWLVVNAIVTERKKIKRVKAGADLASTALGGKTIKPKKATAPSAEKKVKKFKPGAELAKTHDGK